MGEVANPTYPEGTRTERLECLKEVTLIRDMCCLCVKQRMHKGLARNLNRTIFSTVISTVLRKILLGFILKVLTQDISLKKFVNVSMGTGENAKCSILLLLLEEC